MTTDRKHTLAAHDPEHSQRSLRRALSKPLDIYDGRTGVVGVDEPLEAVERPPLGPVILLHQRWQGTARCLWCAKPAAEWASRERCPRPDALTLPEVAALPVGASVFWFVGIVSHGATRGPDGWVSPGLDAPYTDEEIASGPPVFLLAEIDRIDRAALTPTEQS